MRGPFSEYAAPPIYITRIPEKAGIRFSRTELVQLTVAILALSGALTLLNVIQVGFFLAARLIDHSGISSAFRSGSVDAVNHNRNRHPVNGADCIYDVFNSFV